jgi:phage gp46-like protein
LSFDIAINYSTGDFIMAPNMDIQGRTGPDVFEQRIRIRLRIQRGTWLLDPTDGELGSRILELSRVSSERAVAEVEQYVREALEPMTDITVRDVIASINPETAKIIDLRISYQPRVSEDEDAALQSISLTIPT